MPCVSPEAKAMRRVKMREYQARRRQEQPEKTAAELKAWRSRNRERVRADKALYRERHPERVAAQLKRCREAKPEQYKAKQQAAYIANPGPWKARASKRRAALLQRTPIWANMQAIESFYSGCPRGSEVDHVLPLQGETVSGLHVLGNLQYLTMAANRAKGARV